MTPEKIARIENFILQIDGNLPHLRRVLHIASWIAAQEGVPFDVDILTFAAYFHDIAAYPAYMPPGTFDHAEASAQLIPGLAEEWGIEDEHIEGIVEAVSAHHTPGRGHRAETRLLRNADGLDYLGCMAIARDFSKQPGDMKKAMAALRGRKGKFLGCVDYACARTLAETRGQELDSFIERFEVESFGIY